MYRIYTKEQTRNATIGWLSPFGIFCTLAIYTLCATINFSGLHLSVEHEPLFASTKPRVVDEDSFTSDGNSTPIAHRSWHEPSIIDSASKKSDEVIDWTDSIFKREGWDNDPIVIESHKLLFFTVPKNACSTFKRLFRRMMGHQNWLQASPHNPSKNGLKYLGHYSKDKQREFMTSPEWTRAIFVRDPLERTLSAYMDKGMKTGPLDWQPTVRGAHIKRACCSRTKRQIAACREFPLTPFKIDLTPQNFPFDFFVESFMRQCKDSHWQPQHLRMREENWKWINFVGKFENKQNDTRRLLERIGAYDEFGASGWGENSEESGKNVTLAVFEKNIANHKTGSGNRMKDHYSPKTERLVMQYYRLDYSSGLFNFTKPEGYTHKLFGRSNPTRLLA